VPGLIACEGEFTHILAGLVLVLVTALPDNFRTVDLDHEARLPVWCLVHGAIFFVRGNQGGSAGIHTKTGSLPRKTLAYQHLFIGVTFCRADAIAAVARKPRFIPGGVKSLS